MSKNALNLSNTSAEQPDDPTVAASPAVSASEEFFDGYEDLDATTDSQDTADLTEILASTHLIQEKVKTKLRNSLLREDQLKSVHQAIRDRQKHLLASLIAGNMTSKKLGNIVEAFRNLTIKICGIMGKMVHDLALYQEVLSLLTIIPKNGDNTQRALLLKFVFNSMNLQVKLLLKGNSDRIGDLEDVLRDFEKHMGVIANAASDASETPL